jgi:hypothetical protein
MRLVFRRRQGYGGPVDTVRDPADVFGVFRGMRKAFNRSGTFEL